MNNQVGMDRPHGFLAFSLNCASCQNGYNKGCINYRSALFASGWPALLSSYGRGYHYSAVVFGELQMALPVRSWTLLLPSHAFPTVLDSSAS